MAIYQLKTFADLVAAVREELKIQSSDTTSINRIKRDLNIVYLDEVCPFEQWKWLRGYADLTLPARISTGTATVTQHSTTVTLSTAPSPSKAGHWFTADGFNEVYKIKYHTSGSTTLTLEAPFAGTTSSTATYKIWTDKVPLPSDCRETVEIRQDFYKEPMEGMGLQEYRRYLAAAPKSEGRPRWYTTADYVDPAPYGSISGLPASATRSSSGLVKTIVFASDVSSYLTVGDRIQVTGAGDYTYNIEGIVASVSTTTVTYTGQVSLQESSTADTGITVKLLSVRSEAEQYRELCVYPAIYDTRVTLHVDYIKEPAPLEDDTDEPLIPRSDRIVLLYGALERAWTRERNPEEARRNRDLYQAKLAKMAGKVDDSTDVASIRPSKMYLAAKRLPSRIRGSISDPFVGSNSGSSGTQSTFYGTASTVAVFNSSGELGGSTSISTTELNRLDGISSTAVGISDTQTLTNKTIDADSNTITNIENADIKAAAAIAVNKLAAITASRAVVSDSSGFISASAITSTEVTYLDDVEPLTSFSMADNQAAAATIASWAHASFTSVQLEYSIARGAGNRESGRIFICTDGTTAGLSVSGASIGTIGVTFSVDISGTDLRLRYTSTSTGTAPTMKYRLSKWLA